MCDAQSSSAAVPMQLRSDFSSFCAALLKMLISNGDFLRDATLWRAPRALILVPGKRSVDKKGSVVRLTSISTGGALSFVHGRIGPLGRFSYSGAVLKDFRCAEMSSAMPTGAATASNSPISSTLAWRRPNFCGAADASRRTDYSAHTWQHAHPNDVRRVGRPRRARAKLPR